MVGLSNRSSERRGQSGEVVGQLLFSAVLMLGIFGMVLYLTKDLGMRWDLTEEKLYSLSPSTRKVLDRLAEERPLPLRITSISSEKPHTVTVSKELKIKKDEKVKADFWSVTRAIELGDGAVEATVTGDKTFTVSDSAYESIKSQRWVTLKHKKWTRPAQPLLIEAYFSRDVPGIYKIDRQKIVDILDEYDQLGGDWVRVVYYDPLTDESIRDTASRLGIYEGQANEVRDDSIQVVKFFQGLRLRYGGDKQKVLALVQQANAIESQVTPVIKELVTERKASVGLLVRAPAQQPQFMMQQRQQPPGFQFAEQVLRGRYDIKPIDLSKGQVLPEDLDILVVIAPKDVTDWEKYCIDQHIMRGGNVIVFGEAADYSVDQFGSFYRSNFQVDKPDSKLTWKKQMAAYGVKWSEKLVADMVGAYQEQALTVVRGAGQTMALRPTPMPHWFKAVDQVLALKTSNQKFESGFDGKHAVLSGMKALSFYWPTEVNLLEQMPTGVKGQVLVRTSPLGLIEDPPPSTAPATVIPQLQARLNNEERRQIPLVVAVNGKFTSAWKGLDMPKRPLPEKTDKAGGLLVGQDAEKKTQDDKTEAKNDEQKPAEKKAAEQKPAEKKAAEQAVGPPAPKTDEQKAKEEAEKLPERLDGSAVEGRILVVGDSSMIRDDFLRGLPPYGIPRSYGGIEFYQNALDWLALDTDLVELRNKRDVSRALKFIEDDASSKESQEEKKARIASKKKFLRWLNILAPVVLLLGVGVFLWSRRASEKRTFLAGQVR